MWAWSINLIGLIFAFVGALLLFIGSPRDTSENITLSTYSPWSGKGQVAEGRKETRVRLSRIGFAFVTFGFLLQLISAMLQFPR
ncbi:hypothetical protein [Brevibacillus aydinogluensis]|uniref:hypothetical protein n=1 Tax=Brevibacillus aydinogluensis TaxID=927786 RepID=UPI0026F3FB3C|nr:hypothetical protein [Brevibacillus aydinogluensis]